MLLKSVLIQQAAITISQVLVQEGQAIQIDDLMLLRDVQRLVRFLGLGETFAFTNAIPIGRVVKLAAGEATVATQLDLQQETGAFGFPECLQLTENGDGQ